MSVVGVVTAEAGRLGISGVLGVQDATGGIAVRFAEATSFARGHRIAVTGALANPYGQLEIRPTVAVADLGPGTLPAAVAVGGEGLDEALEGRLVSLSGTIDGPIRTSSTGDLALDVEVGESSVRVVADASSAVTAARFSKGASYRLVGIVGQRASKKGSLDGYRVWLRDAADVERLDTGPSPSPSHSPKPSKSPKPSAAPEAMSVARAVASIDHVVTIEATVTAGPALLDASGRRIVVEDSTAAVEVLLANGTAAPAVGSRVSVDGVVTRAYGAPRIRESAIRVLAGGAARTPLELRGAPSATQEWRLVRIVGTLEEVHRLGDRWRAELRVGGTTIPVTGLEGARIPVDSLVKGRLATVIGIVRRPYPSASDRRFAVVPRGPGDVAVAAAGATPAASGTVGASGSAAPSGAASTLDVDLAKLDAHVGEVVRVGGLVVEPTADGATLDDGTATGRVILSGAAAELAPLLEPGDAINATGRVERRGKQAVVVLSDPAGLVRVGDPIVPDASDAAAAEASEAAPTARAPMVASAAPFGGRLPDGAGLVSLVLVSAASAALTLVRRRRSRSRLLASVVARLPGPSPTPSTAPPTPPSEVS
ncbi:MAG: hypothetical protein ACJ77B_08855 [Chloroflexota bacterium]